MTHMQEQLAIAITRLKGCEDIPLPKYQSAAAAGMDLHAAVTEDVIIQPGALHLIGTGIMLAIPIGYVGEIRPRSGIAVRHLVTIANSPATIDADYRGELQVPLINLGRTPFVVARGMRIAQMLVLSVPRVVWRETPDLPPTERGSGCFGHTGQ